MFLYHSRLTSACGASPSNVRTPSYTSSRNHIQCPYLFRKYCSDSLIASKGLVLILIRSYFLDSLFTLTQALEPLLPQVKLHECWSASGPALLLGSFLLLTPRLRSPVAIVKNDARVWKDKLASGADLLAPQTLIFNNSK